MLQTHTDTHIFSLHAVPQIQGTKVREHHLIRNDLIVTHIVQPLALSL